MNRSEVKNAFNQVLIRELTTAFHTLKETYPNARSVVLTGQGNAFSAGTRILDLIGITNEHKTRS